MHFSLPYALKYVLAFVGRGELELARIVLSCIQNNYVNACVQVRVRASVRVCVLIDYAALTPPTPLSSNIECPLKWQWLATALQSTLALGNDFPPVYFINTNS